MIDPGGSTSVAERIFSGFAGLIIPRDRRTVSVWPDAGGQAQVDAVDNRAGRLVNRAGPSTCCRTTNYLTAG